MIWILLSEIFAFTSVGLKFADLPKSARPTCDASCSHERLASHLRPPFLLHLLRSRSDFLYPVIANCPLAVVISPALRCTTLAHAFCHLLKRVDDRLLFVQSEGFQPSNHLSVKHHATPGHTPTVSGSEVSLYLGSTFLHEPLSSFMHLMCQWLFLCTSMPICFLRSELLI